MATLTPQELIDLTGAKRPSLQRRALDRAGIRYIVRIDGTPATTWDIINATLTASPQPAEEAVTLKLDWIGHGSATA